MCVYVCVLPIAISYLFCIVFLKRTQEFNCKLAQIQGDIQALMDYSIVDFDGLPEHLSHVKGSLESDIMPKRWMGLEGPSVALPLPLLEGLKGSYV